MQRIVPDESAGVSRLEDPYAARGGAGADHGWISLDETGSRWGGVELLAHCFQRSSKSRIGRAAAGLPVEREHPSRRPSTSGPHRCDDAFATTSAIAVLPTRPRPEQAFSSPTAQQWIARLISEFSDHGAILPVARLLVEVKRNRYRASRLLLESYAVLDSVSSFDAANRRPRRRRALERCRD